MRFISSLAAQAGRGAPGGADAARAACVRAGNAWMAAGVAPALLLALWGGSPALASPAWRRHKVRGPPRAAGREGLLVVGRHGRGLAPSTRARRQA
jgi:hypothetical protein